jgi:DNA repair protein RadD
MYGNIKMMGRDKCVPDLCGNKKRFGEVKDLRLVDSGNGKWAVYSNNRQLTNVRF